MTLNEVFDIKFSKGNIDKPEFYFESDTTMYRVRMNKLPDPHLIMYHIGFAAYKGGVWVDHRAKDSVTFNEKSPMSVFSTVMDVIHNFLRSNPNVHVIRFAGATDELTRVYKAIAKRRKPPAGYAITFGSVSRQHSDGFAVHVDAIDSQALLGYLQSV